MKGFLQKVMAAADPALCLALSLVVWFTRSVSANVFVTWDEPAWVYRSVKFLAALSRGDLAGTLLAGHPGVLTMWSGALSLAWHRLITGSVTAAQLAAVDALPGLEVHDPEAIRQLIALFPAAKGGIVLLHAGIIAALFWLLKRLVGRRYALLGALFLVLDPYYLALSRVLHTDALTAGFMLISILSILAYLRRAPRRYLLLSGVAAGLAALTKSYGVLLAPVVGLFLLSGSVRGALDGTASTLRRLLGALGDGVRWAVVAAATFVALWPAMWASPLGTLQAVLGASLEYASDPGAATATFFLGQQVAYPGPRFYPVVMFFRTTPLMLVGLALAVGGLLPFVRQRCKLSKDKGSSLTGAMLLYVVLYVTAISLSHKMYDRYVLPALLGVDLLAMSGWARLVGLSLRTQRSNLQARAIAGALVPFLALLQAGVWWRLYPCYYLAYYNPWAGGARQAVETIPVGWGEGVEMAAAYLAGKPDAATLRVATWAIPGLAPFFPGQVTRMTPENLPDVDYVLLYLGDVQAQAGYGFYGQQEPEFVVQLNGIEYAWLYRNTYYEALARDIVQAAQEGDAIVSNRPSAFDRYYQGELPHRVITTTAETVVAGHLDSLAENASHIFYLDYQGADKAGSQAIRRQLGQSSSLLWEKPFAYGTLRCYSLLPSATFQAVEASTSVMVDFGLFHLEGYGLSGSHLVQGQELGLALQWRAIQPCTRDYHIFIHLVDAEGHRQGQTDGPLEDEALVRTSAWEPGSLHLCRYTLAVPTGLPPGQYQVLLGIYDLASMTRLDIVEPGDQKIGDAFNVGLVTVDWPRTGSGPS